MAPLSEHMVFFLTVKNCGIFCMAQETQTGALYQPRGWDGEVDGREVQEGWDICIPMADSC